MIAHDPTFEALAQAPIKESNVQVARQIQDPDTLEYSDDTLVWTSADLLMSVNIDAVGSFLGATTKKAVVKMIGIVNTASAGDLFQIRLGLYNLDPSVSGFEYISEGYFKVSEVTFDYEAGATTVTMYDHMWSAQQTQYEDANNTTPFTYPTTVQGLAEQMAVVLGLELDTSFSDLPNAAQPISVDLYKTISGTTLLAVIQEIAGATGSTARVSDLKLMFSSYSISSENLDSDTLKTLKIGKKFGPVTTVVLGRVPQNDNILISRITPVNNIITDFDTESNTVVVIDHGMPDGNLVRFESTGNLPAPLIADQNYYIYTNGSEDSFALALTYEDALAGTNLIDLLPLDVAAPIIPYSFGSPYYGYYDSFINESIITMVALGDQEIQINNNQIVDGDRETFLPPLFAALVGIEWNEVKSDTVGMGWHEVGDVIQFTQGPRTVNAFISEIHMVLAGSVKENLISTIPDVNSVNHQTAGGVIKTVYNTEIKVDKQQNEITSIVSKQDTFEGQTVENFSEIYQNLAQILLTIQKSGGGNLLLNSVGFAKDTVTDVDDVTYDKLQFWDYNPSYEIDTNGAITSSSSSDSQISGGVSGQVVQMVGHDVYMTQRVNLAANKSLSFGLRVKNLIGAGTATITLSNTVDTFTLNIDDTTGHVWEEFKLEDFATTVPWLDVKIQVTDATQFMFTDLRLLYGANLQSWIQASTEILTTNVQFSNLGMRIFDNIHDTETQVTYNEFSTRRKADGVVLFEADDSGVVTNDLSIKGSTSYVNGGNTVIKQITIPNSSGLAGIAFIKVV